MTLREGTDGQEYVIKGIDADDAELTGFLFSLGCYIGETITLISHRNGGYVVSIKDGRYNIDSELANAIKV